MSPTLPFDAALLEPVSVAAPTVDLDAPPTTEELALLVATMDYTTLASDDTPARIGQLCATAQKHGVAAVCVYPVFVPQAKERLTGTTVKVATVAAAFPHGLSPLSTRMAEVEACRDLGADDIDIVIRRGLALDGEWEEVYREVSHFRHVAGEAHLKSILGTGDLGSETNVYRASMAALLAGSDFIKTSTGKESVNATPEVATTMLQALARFRQVTGRTVGFKAAGGIRTAQDGVKYVRLARAIMGEGYATPATFRIGASGLLDDVLSAKLR